MKKHNIDIDLTVLKEIVATLWQNPEKKEQFFRTYEDKNGKTHNILKAEIALFGPKYAEKADGSKIESETAILHSKGMAQVSEKNGEEWVNHNFARLQQWIDKVDTTPPSQDPITEDELADSIPF